MKSNSWIIIEKVTKKVICETFSEYNANCINAAKYEAVPAHVYLAELNAKIKAENSAK